ncbi:MAG: ABC transporter substrate-binding protein [Actinobacteria bacterium]|nr:ABC transporter substrate-binding protein [Actinomycetota bacterium]
MKHKKFILVMGVLAVVGLIFAGCGGGATTTTSAPATTVTSATTSSTEAATSTTGGATSTTTASLPDLTGQSMEIAAVWSSGEQDAFQKVIDAFTAATHAKVTFTSTGNDIATILGTRIAGGNPPDVAFVPQPGLMAALVQQNALQPIGDLVSGAASQYYSKGWIDLGTINGTMYGLVYKLANKSTFWYSIEALKNAGVTVPIATWDDLISAAGTISSSGITPFSIGGGDGWTLTDWFENIYLRTAGADMYQKLATHAIPWTDPSVTTALQDLAQIFSQSSWVAGGNSGALQVTFPQSVVQVFGSPQKAAMVYEGDFVAGVITSQTKAKLGTDADWFPFPSINGSAPAVMAGGDTAVLLKDSAAGKAFIQFIATPDASDIWVKQGGFTSPNSGVPLSDYPDPILAKAAEEMQKASSAVFDMSDQMPPAFGGTPSQGEWKLLQDFLANPGNLNSIQQQLESAAKAAFGS